MNAQNTQSRSQNTDSELCFDSDTAQHSLAALYKACADTLRLDILSALQYESFSVQELCHLLQQKQSSMSHHLKVLVQTGLVSSRREGNFIFYQRQHIAEDLPHKQAVRAIFNSIDEAPIQAELKIGIETLRSQRAEQSKAFFADNAKKFRSQQELIATFEQYQQPLMQLMEQWDFSQQASALEIGPGEGAFLPWLSQRFKQVIALDNSAEMLAQARANVAESNILFIDGDTQAALAQSIRVDAIIINMVLHHTPTPAAIFQDMQQLLLPGGRLLVTELCQHHQSWVREACGDLWLGFEPEELSRWAQAALLEPGQAQYFALRNGFQFQIREFIKPQIKTA